jgi:hypothetical protein
MKKIKKQHKLDKKFIQLLEKKPYKLFLDNIRTVDMVFSGEEMEGWTVCKSSKEAIEVVSSYGYLPDSIAFDHDLGEEDNSVKFILWMINAHLDERIKGKIPTFSVHSDNPKRKQNIISKMTSWKRVVEGE